VPILHTYRANVAADIRHRSVEIDPLVQLILVSVTNKLTPTVKKVSSELNDLKESSFHCS
jgi:hypothetical protein